MPLIKTIAVKDGRDKALAWLKGIKRNAKLYQHSSGTVAAVNNGDVAVASATAITTIACASRSAKNTWQAGSTISSTAIRAL
jgi:ABC-type Fe3+ transport system substrate-binding protein